VFEVLFFKIILIHTMPENTANGFSVAVDLR